MLDSTNHADDAGDSPHDLAAFGFDGQAERWLALARQADMPSPLGRVGGFELLEEISRGGQGVVYRARCAATGRQIAVKRLLAGALATPTMRLRFEREVDALTSLSHSNIVTAFAIDAAGGGDLLGMEWVEGVTVTDWARPREGHQRSFDEMARLMLKVCEAVQHAHQRGLIHRDLKPSNILIDAADEPQVLDFGLAKRMTQNELGGPASTTTGQFVGTPAYASPDQLRGTPAAVDIRSDIYSLGVILYEMLTGRLPYQVGDRPATVEGILKTAEPRRPASVDPAIPRNLEAITLKAIERECTRRYQTVEALACDLRATLAGEPISAGPPTPWLYLAKFVRRHRLAAGFGLCLFALIAAFGVFSTILASRLAEQRDGALAAEQREMEARRRAERQSAKARAIGKFLEGLLATAEPAQAGSRDVTLRTVLDAAVQRMGSELAEQPEAQAEVRMALGRTYMGLDAWDLAEKQFLSALEYYRSEQGGMHADVLAALGELGGVAHARGDSAEAVRLAAESLSLFQALAERNELPERLDLNNLAAHLCRKREYESAKGLYRSMLDAHRRRFGDEHLIVADDMNALAGLLVGLGENEEAQRLQQQALALRRRLLGERHADVAEQMSDLAATLSHGNKLAESELMYEQVLEMRRSLLGDRAPAVSETLFNLVGVLMRLNKFEKAEAPAREMLELQVELHGDGNRAVAPCYARLGRLLCKRGKPSEAEPMLSKALAIYRAVQSPGHWMTAAAATDLGTCLMGLERYTEAEPLLLEGYEGSKLAPRYRKDDRQKALQRLVELYTAWNQPDKARQYQQLLETPPLVNPGTSQSSQP